MAKLDAMPEKHAHAMRRLRLAVEGWTIRQAADAFLASLSTRRLDWRQALCAVVTARHLPDHEYVKQKRYDNSNCAVCGFNDIEEEYGHSPGRLAGFLEELGGERPRPTAADAAILNAILAVVVEMQRLSIDGRTRRAELLHAIGPLVKGNKYQRLELLDDLGRASVLATAANPGFLRRWVDYEERPGATGNNEFAWPFAQWTAADGIDAEAARELFGHAGVIVPAAGAPPPSTFDEAAARAELTKLSANARGEDQIAEVVFAPGGLWIARLTDGRYALLYKVKRRWRWLPGTRDEVLASVPDTLFEAAMAAVRASAGRSP